MTVKVNLLPREVGERNRARRVVTGTALALVVYLALLGGLYAMKLAELNAAENERDAVRAEVARLEAEVARLEQYRQLADELDARNQLLAESMEAEISYARVLNDLSLAFPSSSSMRTLDGGTFDRTAAAPGATIGETVAQLMFNGYSVERVAPGVEAVLVEFDKVPVFFNTYLDLASQEEIGETVVMGFDGAVHLTDGAYTRRYANGLPEGERP